MTRAGSDYDFENKLWMFMPDSEERCYYEEVLNRIIKNPRYYLNNLDRLHTFRVSFINYSYKKKKPL